jgi:hypothetical protein
MCGQEHRHTGITADLSVGDNLNPFKTTVVRQALDSDPCVIPLVAAVKGAQPQVCGINCNVCCSFAICVPVSRITIDDLFGLVGFFVCVAVSVNAVINVIISICKSP